MISENMTTRYEQGCVAMNNPCVQGLNDAFLLSRNLGGEIRSGDDMRAFTLSLPKCNSGS
jgi:hypothetical protein